MNTNIFYRISEKTRYDIRWNDMFIYLQKYVNKNNSLVISNKEKELQTWVNTQRSEYKKGTISPERIDCLNKIKFDWKPRVRNWHNSFRLLLEYKQKYGTTHVPSRYSENQRLGQWVSEQRVSFKLGQLGKDKIKKLDEINFSWICPNLH